MSAFERSRGAFRLTTDAASMDLDAIHAYLTRSYWSEGISKELVSRAMAVSGTILGEMLSFAKNCFVD